ncbi:hypothetical protein HLH17_12585 [Acinetobacter sp. ANC 5380]|uniref:PilC beta-propeller domain-containing protein n=1 Tax=Acinetobacter terrae TaxID=2731247 RepID=A0A7Y2RGY6_9GAMM|nr:hypothetical protein [Acinetobacter terrae]NNH78492.1 hypothetical protein [Acinetobacter terrae]
MKKFNPYHALDLKVQYKDRLNQFKVSGVAAAITSLICASVPTYAADLEIYKIPEDSIGATTLMMMLDLSGSMGYGEGYSNTSMSIQEDYSNTWTSSGKTVGDVCYGSKNNVKSDTTTTSYYTRYYCEVASTTTNQKVTGYWSPSATDANRKWIAGCEKQTNSSYRCYDRLTRLKDGLRQVLVGTATVPKIDDKIIIGLSTFAGNNGYIRIPARSLNTIVSSTTIQEPYTTIEEYQERVAPFTKTENYEDIETYYDTVNYSEQRLQYYSNTTTGKGCGKGCTTDYYATCKTPGSIVNGAQACTVWNTTQNSLPSGYKTSSPWTSISCNLGNNNNCKIWSQPKSYQDGPKTRTVIKTRQVDVFNYVTRTRTVTKYRDKIVNKTQRELLLDTLKDLVANGGTPTPYAYAEAAAYLLGTTTVTDMPSNLQGYFVRSDNKRYYAQCGSNVWDGTKCTSWNYWYDNYSNYTPPVEYTKDSAESTFEFRSNGQNYSYKGYYYTGLSPNNYSGFSSSSLDTIKNSKYEALESITSQKDNAAKKECSGQGIYFLTDGQPQPGGVITGADGTSGTAYTLMSKALDTKANLFDCSSSPLGKRTGYDRVENGWACVGKFAQALLDPAKNPTGLKIQTAVVGFGSSFGGGAVETDDVKDAKDWGIVGNGGWIAGSSPEDVAKSINDFIGKLNKDVPSMSTGSSTIPMDALNPEIIQPYAYSPQFEPKVNPADKQQLWFGNLKKYYVVNNGVYSNASGGADYTVVKKSKLQDLTDIWAKSGIDYSENTPIYKKGGVLSQLVLGIFSSKNDKNEPITLTGRKLLTDYVYDGTQNEEERISRDFDLNRINYTYTTDEKTKTDAADRVQGLMALLGYNLSGATEDVDLSTETADLRQMGSIYHSLPVLLTQEGKAVAEKNATSGKVQISTTGRKDYVMFGTTQGLLSVVNASTGVEQFSFVPKEMIEHQAETFKANAGNLAGGKDALYYGIDGEWVAHTVYVTKPDGTLTVNGAVRNVVGSLTDEKENLNGKQWVYGGMRMGGRSYYALDLTDIDNPKLKFHIDPSTGKVYSKANPSGKVFAPIENMAQSWSKPKLDYINWQGKRKLVMFVGGGYDAGGENGDGLYANDIRTGYEGYETYNYNQDNKKGSGVYMFDADTGDLLWYADSTQPATPSDPNEGEGTVTDEEIAHATNADLKYSIASDIKTIDRNNDGVVDHLYFGDLAGQAFRVDFQNNGKAEGFDSQVTKILNLHKDDGTSPRFYIAPVFTAHHSAHRKEGANIIVASFISGNKSSPLLATSDSPSSTGKKDPLDLQYDAVYAIYDYDIHPDGTFYPQTHITARTLAETDETTASTSKLKYINKVVRDDNDDVLVKGAITNSSTGWGGWYYRFDKKFDKSEALQSIVKGITPLIAMEGSLYVTMYDASNNGTSSSCGAGVKGHSFTQRLCLPTGVCPEDANYSYNLGAGIVNLNVGPVEDNKKSIVVPDPNDIGDGCVGDACNTNQNFITAGGSIRFIPNRWYERYAKAD